MKTSPNESPALASIDTENLADVSGGMGPWRAYAMVRAAEYMAAGYPPPPAAYYYRHFRYWR